MFIDYVVKVDINSPQGITQQNNLFKYCWVVEKDDNSELSTPKLVAGKNFANYFTTQKMVDFGEDLGEKEIYLVNNTNLSVASNTCFWLVITNYLAADPQDVAKFQGFKIFTTPQISDEAKTAAMQKYTCMIVDSNTATAPYELIEAYLNRTTANLNDMQYMSLATWQPILNKEEEYKEARDSHLTFANTPDLSTPSIELAYFRLGGISPTRLFVGEIVKQALQQEIKLFIQNSKPNMEADDYILVQERGQRLLNNYIRQNLIGAEAKFIVDMQQSTADEINGILKNVNVNLDGLNSLWGVEATLFS
ncbi:MAG: hypothetical protein LBH40_05355 [Alphaproteobacteria bacterium]|jgi:hypothetical protein|nr:hypothetical protein [Alphaproteobacteria bacterium]